MSEIKKLIERLCPEGVEYIELGVIAQVIRGERITKRDLVEDGEYPVMSGGVSYFGRYTNYNREANTITVAQYGSAGYVSFIKEKFWANDVCYSVLPSKRLNNKYCYYVLCNLQNTLYSLTTKAIPDCLPKEKLTSLEIPVPPIEVQSKIVEILDNFTELEAELKAELEARRKQYEYYRNQLLTFDKVGGARFDVKWMKVGDMCEVTDYVANGSFASLRENVQYKNEPDFALLVRTVDLSQNFNGDKVYINEHAYNFLSKSSLHGGEIIINNIGAGVGQTFRCPYRNEPMSLGPNSIIVKTPNNDFYYHWFNSFYGQKAMSEIITPGALPKFNKTGFKSILIPIPPLEEQKRIVSILDRFEALTTDLQSGLPAEIEARRKQYEYYREKLLTFKGCSIN